MIHCLTRTKGFLQATYVAGIMHFLILGSGLGSFIGGIFTVAMAWLGQNLPVPPTGAEVFVRWWYLGVIAIMIGIALLVVAVKSSNGE